MKKKITEPTEFNIKLLSRVKTSLKLAANAAQLRHHLLKAKDASPVKLHPVTTGIETQHCLQKLLLFIIQQRCPYSQD